MFPDSLLVSAIFSLSLVLLAFLRRFDASQSPFVIPPDLSWDAKEVLNDHETAGENLDWLWRLDSARSSNPSPENCWERMKTRSFREHIFSNDRKDPDTTFLLGSLRPTVSEAEDEAEMTEFGEEDFEDPKNRKVFLLESTLRELKKDNKLKEEKILWQSNELKVLRKAVETMALAGCDSSRAESLQEELNTLKKNFGERDASSKSKRDDIIAPLSACSKEKGAGEQLATKASRSVSLPTDMAANKARTKTRPVLQNPNQVTRLIVKNLPYSVTRADLTAFLPGDVQYVQWLHLNHGQQLFTGIAFVEMATSTSAANAVAMTGSKMMGRTITIDYARANDRFAWPPAAVETKMYYNYIP